MLPAWSLKLKNQPRHYIDSTRLILITLAFLGLFFLLMPTHVQTNETSANTALSPEIALTQRDQAGRMLSDLFTKTEKPSAEAAQQFVTSEQHNNLPQQINSAADERTTIQTQNKQSDKLAISHHNPPTDSKGQALTASENHIPGTSPSEGKKIAAQSAGNDIAETSDKTLDKGEAFEQVKFIEISSAIESKSTAFDNTLAGNSPLSSPSEQAMLPNAPVQHPQKFSSGDSINTSATLLSAEQRNIVEYYFKQLDKINEANK